MIPWSVAAGILARPAPAAVAEPRIGCSSPTDFQQGEGYRIIFIHVPTSWMSMFICIWSWPSGPPSASPSTPACRA